MGYSPWGHKGSDTTERVSMQGGPCIVNFLKYLSQASALSARSEFSSIQPFGQGNNSPQEATYEQQMYV